MPTLQITEEMEQMKSRDGGRVWDEQREKESAGSKDLCRRGKVMGVMSGGWGL